MALYVDRSTGDPVVAVRWDQSGRDVKGFREAMELLKHGHVHQAQPEIRDSGAHLVFVQHGQTLRCEPGHYLVLREGLRREVRKIEVVCPVHFERRYRKVASL